MGKFETSLMAQKNNLFFTFLVKNCQLASMMFIYLSAFYIK
jgi:hypothetical protein